MGLQLPGRGVEPITLWGNPVLREKAMPVTTFDKRIRKLVEQLFETMYAIETGVGLAANQIGRREAAFVFDCRDGLVGHVINPRIELIGDELQTGNEGCLSLPGPQVPTVRHERCRVIGQDVDGNDISYEGEVLRSRCFQHEVDHLNGLVYLDHAPEDVRRTVETAMKSSKWYGKKTLAPSSATYKNAQQG